MAFSTHSALRPGLPYAFLSLDLNYVPSSVLKHKTPPPDLELVKYYFRPQFEELQSRFHKVEALGAATLGEWYKGLEASGNQSNADAARFEQWELHSGFSKHPVLSDLRESQTHATAGAAIAPGQHAHTPDRTQYLLRSGADTPSSGFIPFELSTTGSVSEGKISAIGVYRMSYDHRPTTRRVLQLTILLSESQFTAGQSSTGLLPTSSVPAGVVLRQEPLSQTPTQLLRHKAERSSKEAKEAKAERRKEIERRCLALDPPIMPTTLPFMEAFQAAILISLPLDDKAWEVLKPRLQAQHADAEHRENQVALNNPSVQQARRDHFEQESRVARENTSQMFHGLKVPGRDKLQQYADNFIHLTWSDGRGVTNATASKFAAEVLCHVRQSFDEEITQQDRMLALKGTAFPQDPESLSFRKLKLEDMKWVFEGFVKPITDRLGMKELFLCHVCDTNQKLFSFEAMIQHFAAKHTNAFSRGSSIVHWKADWPADSPFDPHPNTAWALGGAANAPKVQHPQYPRSSFPLHGLPSSVGRGARSEDTFTRHLQQPQAFANTSPYRGQSSFHTSSGQDSISREPDQSSSSFVPGAGASTFTHSSVARSDFSGLALDDDHDSRHHPGTIYRGPMTQSREESFQLDKFPGQAVQPHLLRKGAPWDEHSHRQASQHPWDQWKDEQAVPNEPMPQAFEYYPTRFSYGGPIPRPPGVRSEFGRESRASSRISHGRDIFSDSGVRADEPISSRPNIDPAATRAAVEAFLANFNPTASDELRGNTTTTTDPTRSPYHRPPVNSIHYQGRTESWNTASSYVPQYPPSTSSPQQRTSLPVRETDQGVLRDSVASGRPDFTSPQPSDQAYESARRPIYSNRHMEESLGKSRRTRYGSAGEDVHDMASNFAQPPYQRQYIYDRDGRQYYEEIEVARYPVQGDRFADHASGRPSPSDLGYRDNRDYFRDQSVERGDYSHVLPQARRIQNLEHDPQQIRGQDFDDHYPPRESVVSEPGTRTLRFNHRDIIYQPVEEAMHGAPRSSGMSHTHD